MVDASRARPLLFLAVGAVLVLFVAWLGTRLADALLGPFSPVLGALVLALLLAAALKRF